MPPREHRSQRILDFPTATGALLSACQGITFNVAVFNAVTGELSFTPANNTTLTAAIGAGDATIPIASPTGFGNSSVISYLVRIDTELMLVTSGQTSTTWGVTRGVNGTTAAPHSSGATVNNIVTLGRADGQAGPTECEIDFSGTVLRVPTHDGDPAPGIQTNSLTRALWTDQPSQPSFSSAGSSETTVIGPDLAIVKTDNTTTYIPGGATTYTITVTNSGSGAITGAVVTDTFPAAITAATWSCLASAGSSCATPTGAGNINTTVNLLPLGTATFTVTASISGAATGNLVNTGVVTPPAGINNPGTACTAAGGTYNAVDGSCSSTDTDTPVASANLSIVKTDGTTIYTPGGTTTYTITVTNGGPSAVTNAAVTDTFPAAITSAPWTCVASGGSSCTAGSGTGNISTTVSLIPLGTATFVVTANISAAATGNLVNAGTVTPPAGVGNPGTACTLAGSTFNAANGSCTSTDTDTPAASANLSIVKTDGTTTYTPGGTTTYTITVTNGGPSAVTNAAVTDTFPAAITSASWTCLASAGSSCGAASGTGNISTTASLLVSGTATYTVTASISPAATGPLVNTGTVTPPAGTTNPGTSCTLAGGTFNPATGSCTSTDTDTPTPVADLSILKTDGVTVVTAGTTTTYTITVTNKGPSAVALAPVTDTFPAAITSDTWTCNATGGSTCTVGSGTGPIATTVSLALNGTATFVVTANISAAATGTLVNSATVTPPVGTTNPGTACTALGSTFTAATGGCTSTDTDTINAIVNPTLTKAFSPTTFLSGGTTTLTFTVTSPAGDPALTNVGFIDSLPSGLQIAGTPAVGGTCANAVAATTAAAGATTITVANLQVPAGPSSCTVTVAITNKPGQVNPDCSALPVAFTNAAGNVTVNQRDQWHRPQLRDGDNAFADVDQVVQPDHLPFGRDHDADVHGEQPGAQSGPLQCWIRRYAAVRVADRDAACGRWYVH